MRSRPAALPLGRSACGRAGACGRDQQRFLLAGQLASGARARLLMQGLLKIALHEAALGAVDGRAADAEALGSGLVRHPGSGREQDLGALELAGRMPATPEQGLEVGALGVAARS